MQRISIKPYGEGVMWLLSSRRRTRSIVRICVIPRFSFPVAASKLSAAAVSPHGSECARTSTQVSRGPWTWFPSPLGPAPVEPVRWVEGFRRHRAMFSSTRGTTLSKSVRYTSARSSLTPSSSFCCWSCVNRCRLARDCPEPSSRMTGAECVKIEHAGSNSREVSAVR